MNICLQLAKELSKKEIKMCMCMYSEMIRILYKIENVVLFGSSTTGDSLFFVCFPIILSGTYMVSFIIN